MSCCGRPEFFPSPPEAGSSGESPADRDDTNHPTGCTSRLISSDFDEAFAVRDELIADARKHGYDESSCFGIQLAFDEAIANAIIHGNSRRVDAQVEITYRVNATGIYICIRDEGTGFDPESVDDPTRDENLEIPAGRGLFLMRAYMTSVEYNGRGNVVVMTHERRPHDRTGGCGCD